MDFFVDTLDRLIKKGLLKQDMRVLVVCGGEYDADSLRACGFTDVTISNLDQKHAADFSPFAWSYQDAEELTFADNEFDLAIAHSGLHHCRSPHRALLEIFRVARVGIVVFEPIDNFSSRLGQRLGLGQQYEVAAVAVQDCRAGGVRNTSIPNFVYRWTPREIEKTISSFSPVGQHEFSYFYAMRLNWQRMNLITNRLLRFSFALLSPVARVIEWFFPRQCNNFAAAVFKPQLPEGLHPWLRLRDGQVNIDVDWIRNRYSK